MFWSVLVVLYVYVKCGSVKYGQKERFTGLR